MRESRQSRGLLTSVIAIALVLVLPATAWPQTDCGDSFEPDLEAVSRVVDAADEDDDGFSLWRFGKGLLKGAAVGAVVGVAAGAVIATAPVWVTGGLVVGAVGVAAYGAYDIYSRWDDMSGGDKSELAGEVVGGLFTGGISTQVGRVAANNAVRGTRLGLAGRGPRAPPASAAADGISSRYAAMSARIRQRVTGRTARQSTDDVDALYRQAQAAQEELHALSRSVADRQNGELLFPETLKGRPRALDKITNDYGGDASQILDISRGSIKFNTVDDLYAALRRIDQRAEIVRIKDRFVKPTDAGYRDVLVNVRMSNGHVAELQLHLNSILKVKNGRGHQIYERIRSLEGAGEGAARPLSAAERQELDALLRESRRLYDEALSAGL